MSYDQFPIEYRPLPNDKPSFRVESGAESEDPIGDATKVLGFRPDLLTNVVGVTMKDDKTGINRQEVIKVANGLMSRYGKIPVVLQHDPNNKWDQDALEVHLPVQDDAAGGFVNYSAVGFITTRQCWNCYNVWSAGQKKDDCPKCNTSCIEPRNYLNKYIVSHMKELDLSLVHSSDIVLDKDESLIFGVAWISYGSNGKSLGVRLGFKFPKSWGLIKLEKPEP